MIDVVQRVASAIMDAGEFDFLPRGTFADQEPHAQALLMGLAVAAIDAMRVSDADVMAHEWLGSEDQDSINGYIDAALKTREA